MKAIRKITAILLLIIGLLVVGSAALASDTAFDKVKVDGVDMTSTNTVYVERGQTIDVYVQWTAGTDTSVDREDLTLEAWVSGYDWDDVENSINLNEMDAGDTISKTLHLELPEDMDARDTYTLHVELSNKHDIYINEEYNLKISPEKHKLAIDDITLRPSSVVAGAAIFASVRVENLGYEKEENIKVTISIPDLGVTAKDYIDELVTADDDSEDYNMADSTPEMKLAIPSDAKAGTYNLKILVSYDDGHETVEATETINVKAAEATPTEEVPATLINIDSSSKDATAGVEVPFKIMVANIGDEVAIYSLEIAGADLWATTRVEPAMVTLPPDATGEMFVYIKPKTDTTTGTHTFTAKVKAGNTIVAEKTLTASVTGTTSAATGATTTNGQTNFASLKNALVIGFGVLVVLLVILGLIIAFNKMSKDEDEEIPGNNEGQAYY
ncbi:MAG: putative S-layer protein [Nanoarchaeota archaeon]|nr:putative S-layer protein [Nanoarchaeota archaeon]